MATRVELRAKISNQISAMQQTRKLHSHDWIVLMRLIGESLTLLDTLSQSLTEAQGEIARLKTRNQELRDGWVKDEGKFDLAYSEAHARVEALESALAAMREEREKNATSESQGEPATNGLMPLPDVAALQQQLAHLTEEREGLRAQIEILVMDASDSNACCEQAEAKLAALTAAHERVRALIRDYESDLRGYRDDITPVFVRDMLRQLDSALTSPEGQAEAPTWQLPAGLWANIQGVVLQTLGPVVVSEEDWHRIAAKMPFRDVGETPEPSRGRASHAPDCPCPQCALAREAEVARKLKDHTPERSG